MKKILTVLAIAALVAFAAPAFAANPFMDVPAGHWAYDAVAQLAADGIISGYPDGAFKGAQPATRYEVASMVARALAKVDMDKASKQDLEMLKKLVMEFKDELDALGVKVDGLDKRVATLESNIGGWKVRGAFRFDARFGAGDNKAASTRNETEDSLTVERFRLFLTKTIDENTSLYAEYRAGANDVSDGNGSGYVGGGVWRSIYVDTKLPYDINFRIGRFNDDWEGDYGLYTDFDALYGDFQGTGIQLQKSWGGFTGTAIVKGDNDQENGAGTDDYMQYQLRLAYENEKFFGGLMGYWFNDKTGADETYNYDTYGVFAGFHFTPNITLKGVYYWQNLKDAADGAEDSPKAWKAILDINQEALKFTSLWVEYSQRDNAFESFNYQYRYNSGMDYVANYGLFQLADQSNTSKIWFVKAAQQWNDKWGTYERFTTVDFDTEGWDDAKEYGIGITYQYSPAIGFELGWDRVDHGNTVVYDDGDTTNDIILFRTNVSF